MHVLGIVGTPRPGGNSEILVRHALAPFEEAGWSSTVFLCSARTVAPCRGCDACLAGAGCAVGDDMDLLYRAYEQCDALLVASPVYYRNVTAQLKAVFDRTYAARGKQPLAGKLGGAIAVGRGTGGGQALVLTVIYNWMLSCGVVCVPGELNGVSAVADAPGDILAQPRRLGQARTLGENLLYHAMRLRGEKDRGGNT